MKRFFTAAAFILLTGCSASPPVSQSENIRVTEPAPHQTVSSPVTIRGEARLFESTFSYRIRDENGTILMEDHAMANSPDVGEFGPFTVHTSFRHPLGKKGMVEVFDYSAKDGSEQDMVRIPVGFP